MQTIAPAMRACTNCGESKPETAVFFPPHKQCRGGLNTCCRACRKAQMAKWRERNRDSIRVEHKAWRDSHPARLLAYRSAPEAKKRRVEASKARYEAEKAAGLFKAVNKSAKRKAYEKAYSAFYYEKNKDRALARSKERAEKKREEIRAHLRARYRFLRDAGDHRALRSRLSRAVRRCLASEVSGGKQRQSCFKLLGYTSKELLDHLVSGFTEGMTVELLLKGAIHIDHIRPISSFSIAGVHCPEFKACWALKNLQPLWAIDNIRKGAKWSPPEHSI